MNRVPVEQFGRDHLTTILYLETVAVDRRGKPGLDQMRCNVARHPGLSGRAASLFPWDPKHSTTLRDGSKVDGHDDWDCVEDMIAAGWLEWHGTGINPIFALTNEGWSVAHQLRRLRAAGHDAVEGFHGILRAA